ncbi:hypothetical protein PUMCH_001141 [Australozyma saopauloensis]|uniref:Cell division control protein 73 C-terminal domain-containing protein n=1 Tax=Australozyma saopauloensis TaxID=291208 RepID=A0AAX4H5N2_9ASCO|nr:hypothetical protein PUMCH_001141 [[Candida] saopauloensis]
MDALRKLKDTATKGEAVQLLTSANNEDKTDSIKDASHVQFGSEPEHYALDEPTDVTIDGNKQSLRAVVFCWMHDKSSIVDYKDSCLQNNVPDFKFLVKEELNAWLNGTSDQCKFIELPDHGSNGSEATTGNENGTQKRKAADDPRMARIAQFEINSLDHNAALHGTKNVMLKNLISDAKKFASQLKKTKLSKTPTTSVASAKKQPIIIVSPATTALLSLTNIKQFLEEGKFVEPSLQRVENNVVTIERPSNRFVSPAHSIMVVDNVDLFTKPEYWDRVIAIFTTGQAWQFAKYKYSKPEILFQKYPGFYMSYQGDIVPKQIHDWNVSVVSVDRGEKRFRDKMIVKDLWMQLDKILLARNYGVE